MAPQTPRDARRAETKSRANTRARARDRRRALQSRIANECANHKENSPAPSSIFEDESMTESDEDSQDSVVVESPNTPFTSPITWDPAHDPDERCDLEGIVATQMHSFPTGTIEASALDATNTNVDLLNRSPSPDSSIIFEDAAISEDIVASQNFTTTLPVWSNDKRSLVTIQGSDRFIPRRTFVSSFSDRFHTNIPAMEMTTMEAMTRRSTAAHDPFVSTPQQRRFAAVQRTQALAYARELRQYQQNNESARVLGRLWDTGDTQLPIHDARAHLMCNATGATRQYTTSWPSLDPGEIEERDLYNDRIGAALGLNRASRILPIEAARPQQSRNNWGFGSDPARNSRNKTRWDGAQWVNDGPCEILDAKKLRNDFYCSLLSWCDTHKILAVGLGGKIYAWTDKADMVLLKEGFGRDYEPWISALAFSSDQGNKAILAWCCADGDLGLMSMNDFRDLGQRPNVERYVQRFDSRISCLAWRPKVTWRRSRNPLLKGKLVKTEDLVVGDERGAVSYFAVEWPADGEERCGGFHGSVTLLARVFVHSQQVCGLSWSPDGSVFACGGDDNVCSLFDAKYFIRSGIQKLNVTHMLTHKANELMDSYIFGEKESTCDCDIPRMHEPPEPKEFQVRLPRHTWVHAAAVKAIAFCPWRPNVLATGGGSADKCIHFFDTRTGKELAEIKVSAQVTSLVWSKQRREIVATFGFAVPEHNRRVAVFSWPECTEDKGPRALHAIWCPLVPPEASPKETREMGGGRDGLVSRRDGIGSQRESQGALREGAGIRRESHSARRESFLARREKTLGKKMEGCIVIASSDGSVKFQEVWAPMRLMPTKRSERLGGASISNIMRGSFDDEFTMIR
ncbi:hypothetical protein TD95_004920 [Thielaviopsis punctulata]|uniref:Anaphase-promoting complex subunit 4 WD40 domain-containing protein n=1 Tax=Thielaviopsis punctulata TaxID=72032 RepID=A0A0F4ZE00_9PEZI|nr:hypothetical protein TD95_004920 [Thielaviopsis punctulata]